MLLLLLLFLLVIDNGLPYITKKVFISRHRYARLNGVPSAMHYDSNEEVSVAIESLQKLLASKSLEESDSSQFISDKLLILGSTLKAKKEIFYPADITHLYWCIEKFCLIDSISSKLLQDTKVCHTIEYIDSVNDRLQLPFKVIHQLLDGCNNINIDTLVNEIPFKNDILKSRDGKTFTERRKTCWMVEEHSNIGGLAYSGKIMPPVPMSPAVTAINSMVEEKTGIYFDCVLVNYYEDGECSCAWHQDPDMGTVWSTDSIIVSFGETRKFSLKKNIVTKEKPFVYPLENLDGFFMFDNCNGDKGYQHCILPADKENGPRISMVFKRSLSSVNGRKGYGYKSNK